MFRIICIIAGYIFGLFNTSLVFGKIIGVDVRKHGSGNTGTANMLRTAGFRSGLVVLIGDTLKAVLSMLLMVFVLREQYALNIVLIKAYTGLGCILGHNYPFYTGFKGGKGIATSFGIMLVLDWRLALFGFGTFMLVFFSTHYMSLGSLSGVIAGFLPIFISVGMIGGIGGEIIVSEQRAEFYIIISLMIFLAFFRHRENISRLLKGEERKTHLHRAKNKEK